MSRQHCLLIFILESIFINQKMDLIYFTCSKDKSNYYQEEIGGIEYE